MTAEREAYSITMRTLESVQDGASPQEVAPLKVLLASRAVATPVNHCCRDRTVQQHSLRQCIVDATAALLPVRCDGCAVHPCCPSRRLTSALQAKLVLSYARPPPLQQPCTSSAAQTCSSST